MRVRIQRSQDPQEATGVSGADSTVAGPTGATGPAGSGSGTTNLDVDNRTASTLDVTSSTGDDATLPQATNTQAGLLTGGLHAKLDRADPITFVPPASVGGTGNAITLTPSPATASNQEGNTYKFETEHSQ